MRNQFLLLFIFLPLSSAWSGVGKCELSISAVAFDGEKPRFSKALPVTTSLAPMDGLSFVECVEKAEGLVGSYQQFKRFGGAMVEERITDSVRFSYIDDQLQSNGHIGKKSEKTY